MKSKRIDEEMKERHLKPHGRCLLPAIFVLVVTGACGVQSDLTNLKNDTTHLRAQMQVMREEVALQEDMDSLKVHIVRLEALVRDLTEELLRFSMEPLKAQLETRRIQTVAWQQENEGGGAPDPDVSEELGAALEGRGYR